MRCANGVALQMVKLRNACSARLSCSPVDMSQTPHYRISRGGEKVEDEPVNLRMKVILVEGIEFLIIALCLFIAAGTATWPAAWIFLGLLFVSSLPITWWLLKYAPELIEERLRFRRNYPGTRCLSLSHSHSCYSG